jgi:hypothetical protein
MAVKRREGAEEAGGSQNRLDRGWEGWTHQGRGGMAKASCPGLYCCRCSPTHCTTAPHNAQRSAMQLLGWCIQVLSSGL